MILKMFYKYKLINRPHCEIVLLKIKSLQEVQNIEDVLKQAFLPAQQEKKQSQSKKKSRSFLSIKFVAHEDMRFKRRPCKYLCAKNIVLLCSLLQYLQSLIFVVMLLYIQWQTVLGLDKN
ncbi:Hypothetical_protein [Hexamita inflata]|uniref:Hypothetical_protein n=1 Tax=Hexamita inflata TaxID=28002 RepID=A0AA86UDI6_9EUKA|nr:Hypothetical protein HINF_LOCUS35371 [Hexamita inflata]